ncbi:MAG: hypothetical protein IJW83_01915 [Clostridia bacterium]|nr:hypothetical protein [Clostridia bacterium]
MENPAPGVRKGQIHYHDFKNGKHLYDLSTGTFNNPTKRLNELLSDRGFLKGLKKALRLLGERL